MAPKHHVQPVRFWAVNTASPWKPTSQMPDEGRLGRPTSSWTKPCRLQDPEGTLACSQALGLGVGCLTWTGEAGPSADDPHPPPPGLSRLKAGVPSRPSGPHGVIPGQGIGTGHRPSSLQGPTPHRETTLTCAGPAWGVGPLRSVWRTRLQSLPRPLGGPARPRPWVKIKHSPSVRRGEWRRLATSLAPPSLSVTQAPPSQRAARGLALRAPSPIAGWLIGPLGCPVSPGVAGWQGAGP